MARDIQSSCVSVAYGPGVELRRQVAEVLHVDEIELVPTFDPRAEPKRVARK